MTQQTLAYKEVISYLDVLFLDQFGDRWVSGFIHFVSENSLHGHRAFVRYRSGVGEWVQVDVGEIIPALKVLIKDKQTVQPGINAIRATAYVNDPNTIQYLSDLEVLTPQVTPLALETNRPLETTEEKVLAVIYDFMTQKRLPGFRYCAFEFFRINTSIAALVRYVDLQGVSKRLEVNFAPALELLVFEYWREQQQYESHLLRICFDHSFKVGVEFEDYHILKELETRENGDFSLRDGVI